MTSQESELTLLERALGQAARVVDGIVPGQAGDPTPCETMDVRELTQHLLSGVRRFGATVERRDPPGPVTLAVGEDWGGQLEAAGAALLAAWRRSGALEHRYPSPVGELPGPVFVELQVVELAAHTWDLARATRQTALLEQDLAAAVLPCAERLVPAERRGGRSPFQPPAEVGEETLPYDRLAAFLGRRP